MSDVTCEHVDSVVAADTMSFDFELRTSDVARSVCVMTLGFTNELTDGVDVSDVIVAINDTLLADAAVATDATTAALVTDELVADRARSACTVVLEFLALVTDGVDVDDTVDAPPPDMLLVDSVTAAETLAVDLTPDGLTDTVVATDSVLRDVTLDLTDEVEVAEALVLLAVATGALTDTVEATESVAAGAAVVRELSDGAAATDASAHRLDATSTFSDEVLATDAPLFTDPARIAWVLNTESAAVMWYDHFDFESVAQVGDKVFAASNAGLFELTGNTDAGSQIQATVEWGFTDFKIEQIKRIDELRVTYVSDGTLQATVGTQDCALGPATYTMQTRVATAPRPSRIIPGKGLWGQYWKISISNVSGANFTVSALNADTAVSNRRLQG